MDKTTEIKNALERLSDWDQKLNFHKPVEKTPDIKAYLNYYNFNLKNVDLHFGKIEIDDKEVIVQIFKAIHSKGTVFLLHGYLEHVGYLKHIIQFLNKHQYSVVSYDLQGHGLSDGKKASVDHFSEYVLTMEKLMRKARKEMPGPFYVIGHSTGAAIVINYVLKHQSDQFDKVILVAPLIRSNHWHLTKVSFYLSRIFPFIEGINRRFRENSSNHKYLNFTRKDPLQPKAIPLNGLRHS
ncbi:alpha/beta hydrolase [Halobacillus shinanisalinarum]|uniref:Alpha/beta hydrolase n=1 Tax=Halobacillus shinanisalinarum TaxID=2932258 RepID=A0ABY4GXB5_9BACI|nr:alpha/beta fold hydrolase [Halobacillus shinanisalinarum]UOQ92801.1 alpha/beta hydrolase [Halobacillus shinanisalinarum]